MNSRIYLTTENASRPIASAGTHAHSKHGYACALETRVRMRIGIGRIAEWI